jgi:hypothetical protein
MFYTFFKEMNKRSVSISKYLNSGLKKYVKYIPSGSIFNSLATPNKPSSNDLPLVSAKPGPASTPISVGQTLAYKKLIYECIYMYSDMLEQLAKKLTAGTTTSDSDQKNRTVYIQLFELVCHFYNELFLLSNNTVSVMDASGSTLLPTVDHVDIDDLEPVSSIPASITRSASVVLSVAKTPENGSFPSRRHSTNVFKQNSAPLSATSSSPVIPERQATSSSGAAESGSQIEVKLDRQFFGFMNSNSLSIYERINEISQQLELSQYVSILISSQLILFKCQQWHRFAAVEATATFLEQDLSLTLIRTVNDNMFLLDNELIVGILLELYMKCATFRRMLNECADFHVNLTSLLNKAFEELLLIPSHSSSSTSYGGHGGEASNHRQTKLNYLEILLDLTFVFFYFNRRVSFLFDFFTSKREIKTKNNFFGQI